MSARSITYNLVENNNEITDAEILNVMDQYVPETILRYARDARKEILAKDNKISKHIQLDTIEPLIIKQLNMNPNTNNIKLALDFIRLKQSTEGLEDEIDINKYLIKLKEGLTK